MKLSFDCGLVYVLRSSGCMGRLFEGRVERHPTSGLNVYNIAGTLVTYISGERMRSWCLFSLCGVPIYGWCEVHPEDAQTICRGQR